jgi:hypothetical protein
MSEVPNESVSFLILFSIFSYLHGLTRTYTCNFAEDLTDFDLSW